MLRPVRRALAAFVLLGMAAPAALAQTFPSRTLSIVVPFAAGGPTDTVSRLVAEAMARDLGQNVVVENVGGAGGTLGSNRVAMARPDGHTLLLHHIGMATTPTLYRRLPYDPVAAFEPLGLITDVPMSLIARPNFPANTLAEVVAVIRQRRDELNYANAGIGAASHLCGLLLMSRVDAPHDDGAVPWHGPRDAGTARRPGGPDVRPDDQHERTDPRQCGARLCGDDARAPALTARGTDVGRGWTGRL